MTGTTDYLALTQGAACIDLSSRGRLCLIGKDRQTFINGQVTNNVKDLRVGQGCYAALVTAKGKMVSDHYIWVLEEEILLDFEPGLAEKVIERLEKFIIADDVQIVDASASYGLKSILGIGIDLMVDPTNLKPFEIHQHSDSIYLAKVPRLGAPGLDLFYPVSATSSFGANLPQASLEAFETVRIERGIPRFGIDMDQNTLVSEALGEGAISYNKGCYIGQEVIARIRTYGQVAKALRSLRFRADADVPKKGDKIFHGDKEVGWITSAVFSPKFQCPIALGYVRKECNQIGTQLAVNDSPVEIISVQA